MPAFFSPITTPSSWSLSIADGVMVPAGLRYAGYALRGLRAAPPAAAASTEGIRCPALGVLRRVATTAPARTFVEVQVNPFPIRRLVARLPWGVPTFYLVFEDTSGLAAFADGDTAAGDEVLSSATTVTVLLANQDRVTLDPALWAAQVEQAITAVAGDTSRWQPFANAVTTQTASGPSRPVLLLDHAGQPRTQGSVEVTVGAAGATSTHSVTLAAQDGGDLQRAVARMHASDPTTMPLTDLFGTGGTPFQLRPSPDPAADGQLAALEDRATAGGQIQVTPTRRHITATDLHAWFAAQTAIPTGATAAVPALARLTRGNKVTSMVNGPEFFRDLFRTLDDARTNGAGLHLAGWAMVHDQELTGLQDGESFAVTLEDAVRAIGDGGGACRLLPSRLYQLQPGGSFSRDLAFLIVLVLYGVLVLDAFKVSLVSTDGSGAVVIALLFAVTPPLLDLVFSSGGEPFEQNRPAVDGLDPLPNASCLFSAHPVTIDDNPLAVHNLLLDAVYGATTNFGVHHQKLAVVRTSTGHVGYCGGIDLNTDRLDDARHLSRHPFHDVHARIEGPAVRDLAISFDERWRMDSPSTSPAFPVPTPAQVPAAGSDVVQVARTYHSSATAARRLPFAPAGDATIVRTMLRAIGQAREFIYVEDQYLTPSSAYRSALVDRVDSGELKKLVIVVPGQPDQPFGEVVRTQLINDLLAADRGRGIVHVGFPRLHYVLPDNDRRASSGRCLLTEDLGPGGGPNETVALGPAHRVPVPPFWVAIEGELMYAYDEALSASSPAQRTLQVARGAATQLISGGATPAGARPRSHQAGAAATVVEFPEVYVHAKLMIVDDVFLGVGSANLNRRGFFHDSEINIFTVPEALKASEANPVAALRQRLWAEMLDLPAGPAAPLLRDPVAAAGLFGRSPYLGNRFARFDARPQRLMFGATTGDGAFANALQAIGLTVVAAQHGPLFDSLVDPTTSIETTL